jgi:alkylhydroperoxidase family enzyme
MAAAAPAVREMMAAQERLFGFVLNPIKQMGHCPTIAEGQVALTQGIEKAGHIEGSLRSLIYMRVATLNGCPF